MLSRLALVATPKLVVLCKALFELDVGRQSFDVCFVRAVITRVDINTLAEILFDGRDEATRLGHVDFFEGLVGGDDAAR